MENKTFVGSVYGFIHFSVEVASFYFLFSRLSADPLWWALALLFDALAFLPQSFFGILTDRNPQVNLGVLGGVLMLTALVLPWDIPALVLLSLGNGMIHISGAQHTLRGTEGKITPNAIFVGAGSFGVITGQLLGELANRYFLLLPVALMLGSILAMHLSHQKDRLENTEIRFCISAKKPLGAVVILTLMSVIVRGYAAYAIPTEWNKTILQSICLFVCMGLGKTIGGVLCDKIGYRRVSIISLLGGLPFLLFGNELMALSLIGVALFSMTMPVTVAILASAFPKRPGLAFGITTAGLFLGSAPAFFVRPQTLFAHQAVVLLLTAVTLPGIICCIKRGK